MSNLYPLSDSDEDAAYEDAHRPARPSPPPHRLRDLRHPDEEAAARAAFAEQHDDEAGR